MLVDNATKEFYIAFIKSRLSQFPEVKKIVIFGSFFTSKEPNDIDVAIVQTSDTDFLTLSLKYRKALRTIAKKIALDILPLKKDTYGDFIQEINRGKVIYEK